MIVVTDCCMFTNNENLCESIVTNFSAVAGQARALLTKPIHNVYNKSPALSVVYVPPR